MAAAPPPIPAPPPAPPGEGLCGALARIVDAEPEGFLALRAAPAAERQWDGALVPPGFGDCWVEDDSAGVRYACSDGFAADGPDPLVPTYLGLLGEIDACLGRPVWYPLVWQRAPDRLTVEGGAEAAWHAAGAGSAGPTVSLALARHPEGALWFVRLAVGPPAVAPPRR